MATSPTVSGVITQKEIHSIIFKEYKHIPSFSIGAADTLEVIRFLRTIIKIFRTSKISRKVEVRMFEKPYCEVLACPSQNFFMAMTRMLRTLHLSMMLELMMMFEVMGKSWSRRVCLSRRQIRRGAAKSRSQPTTTNTPTIYSYLL